MTSTIGAALPADAVLLHIGPHKTGTSAIQGALAAARQVMAQHGVVYPGRRYSHNRESHWPVGRTPGNGRPGVSERDWQRLCGQASEASKQRVVISSEVFDFATADQIPTLVADLGGNRVHVVVTLRPLVAMLPSIWQQRIKSRGTIGYGTWLRRILRPEAATSATAVFWHQHRHDALVRRWLDVVGPDRLTVVVVDSQQPDLLFRSFERLLDLPDGTLVAQPDKRNRSLTAPEVEVLRRLNRQCNKAGLTPEQFGQFMREGVIHRLKNHRTPPPDEPRISTPQWAEDAVEQISIEMVDTLRSLPVRVVGDLDILRAVPSSPADAPLPGKLTRVPTDLAVEIVLGALGRQVGAPGESS